MNELLPVSLSLRVILPRSLLVEAEVAEVSLPGLEGYLGILPGHRPLVIALGAGNLTYKQESTEEDISIRGGYAEIYPDSVLVFTELLNDEDQETLED
jgi:F-type H+-transporting ATPase subunit epsilon